MSEKLNFFIDTNVIAHYLIRLKIKDKANSQLTNRYNNAYQLMLKILSFNSENYKFITSSLSQAEIYYALFDERFCENMFNGGVPYSCWIKSKGKKCYNSADVLSIYDLICDK